MSWDGAWQMVTCKQCRRRYRCSPKDDYYNATNDHDGVCEPCLLGGLELRGTFILGQPTESAGPPSPPESPRSV